MDDNRFDGIKDVKWENINNDQGGIKFKNKRKMITLNNVFKAVAFILIAAISGGASGAYVVNKKVNSKVNNQINPPSVNSKQENIQNKSVEISKNSITKAAETAGPAVVGISNKSEGFFGLQDSGSGSGIIFEPDGHIVTNNHVIEGASKITVKLSSGKVLDAKLIGADPRSDLAVIKVEAENLPVAKFGDSSKVKVGDVAIAIGNPLGEEFAGSVTAGIISALNRRIQYNGAIYKVIQTDAAINPGNSGGALCNEAGEVIGINSLKLGSALNAEGMGFSISINEAKDIIKSLMNYGKVARPSIGIYGQSVVSQEKNIKGIYVREIISGSGAANAGIKPTDIIIELDKKKIVKFEELTDILDKHKVGDTISCKLLRNEKVIEVNIVLAELKDKSR